MASVSAARSPQPAHSSGPGRTAAAFTGGAKDGWYFESDRILVKHDANYSSANKDRLDEAAADGTVTGASGAVSKSCTATAGTAK